MNELRECLRQINRQYKEADEIYREAAAALGFSDSVFWILYPLSDPEQQYTQNDLGNEWFYPKQTVHSAIRKLADDGYVRLEAVSGKRKEKRVCLTEKGKRTCPKQRDTGL